MNLHDTQWQKLSLVIEQCNFPGTKSRNNRMFIEAVFWVVVYRHGWSKLPIEFGKWRTNYMRFRRWNNSGIWHAMAQVKTEDQELISKLKMVANWGDTYLNHLAAQKKRANARNSTKNFAKDTPLNSAFPPAYDFNVPADTR